MISLLISNMIRRFRDLLTLFRMGLFGAAHGEGGKKAHPPIISHIYPAMMKLSSYTLPKEDPKILWITWHTLLLLLTSIFFNWKYANFAISRNTVIDYILIPNFFNFFWVLINMVTISMMSAKMATLGLLKIKGSHMNKVW